MITIDDFKKIELKTAKILEAERVERSDKLIKLKVDLGQEQRQIIAGIGSIYTPEILIGKQIVVVANLEPRKLMGLESQGMLLAASDEMGPVLVIPESEVEPGSECR
ncbi:MAG: methionine--tRNA ligase subunit beta [Candidatus Yanofskybacteria bacterium RIFCSPHIGHO2_01_FULL_42_12]|uniref:Methionine--tRNA ligase n=1 Tax=Candidatus Yanofskybacteria bacterium RIFCSPLOWO2_01_FULL_42_49 TaxID=1802694 RepID=A0A1F8GFT4_9BACT|nr:MAG: methionine--tRNA ligase subunit beta [Candidatus Yanofskybacteria bacterium RIFCSPHIGHO2_01_FULL_42_12]OGN23576.1 MAG: methionine--tRNA ligase subunit beta [Candidatus Yanofskybacteria bacterium RIFCSPLOWO2_01_FULL_42_49]